MNRTKLLQIIGFILITLLLAWALWYFLWRETPVESPPIGEQPSGGQLPGIGEGPPGGVVIDPVTGLPISGETPGQVTVPPGSTGSPEVEIDERARGGLTETRAVVDSRVITPGFVNAQNELNFYDSSKDRFFRLQANGEVVGLSDKKFYNVEKVSWDPSGDKAILEYPDSSNIYYDFTTDQQITLPKQMTEFDFTKNGGQIGYKWMSEYEDDDWLGIAAPNGSEIKFLEPLNNAEDDVDINWSPNGQVVATYREGSGFNRSEVYFIGQQGENFKSLSVPGRGFKGQWMDDGQHMMYEIYSENTGLRPSLWLTRADGDNVGLNNSSLGLQTWIDKCAISGSNAYCAVPEYMPEGAAYVPEVTYDIPDLFYRIDLNTGAKTLLARPVGDQDFFNASQVIVSEDQGVLYFVDRATGRLYSINL